MHSTNLIFSLLLILLGIINFISIKIIINKKLFLLDSHQGPQKIHTTSTSRAGGVIISLLLLIFSVIHDYILKTIYFSLISPFILILIISTIEDIYKPTKPILRLLLIFTSSVIFLLNNDIKIEFVIPLFSNLLNIKLVQLFFLVLIIGTVVNGFNIIDGSNGHTSFIALFSALIIIMTFRENEVYGLMNLLIVFIVLLIIFLIFNFPSGGIFLGDTGAYFIGWLLSITIIYLINNTNEISNLIFLNILFYPLTETIFSFFRKIFIGISPFEPDNKHLHLMMIRYLKKNNIKNFNSLNTLFLSPVWFFPLVILSFINKSIYNLLGLIIFQILVYFTTYMILNRKLD